MLRMAGFLTLHLSVSVSVDKISQKVFNQSTSFLVGAFPVNQGGNHSILKKKSPWGKGGHGRSKFDPKEIGGNFSSGCNS